MTVLSKHITVCSSFWKKATGLMFTRSQEDFAYIFSFKKPRILTITMMFVFYPIDILFAREGVVVEVAKNVRPFSHYVPSHPGDLFVEVPVGVAKQNMVGKKIIWNERVVEIVDE